MNFLLDTCLISELVKKTPDPSVTAWLDRQDEMNFYLSVLTLGELGKGIAKLPAGERRDKLQQWLDNDLVERFAGRVLPVDLEVARVWGSILGEGSRNGVNLPAVDALIAATAVVHGLTVVTRNTGDLVRCRAEVYNPWEDAG